MLVTCGGAKTVQALEPILDDPDVGRAVYAGWVLAQLPDVAAAEKGLRRVAIFALFRHQVYQSGAGIDFPIAPDLSFHQTTVDLNPGRADVADKTPVRIPDALLTPFDWNDAEQQFAVRCYQQCQSARTTLSVDLLNIDDAGWGWLANQGRGQNPMVLNRWRICRCSMKWQSTIRALSG